MKINTIFLVWAFSVVLVWESSYTQTNLNTLTVLPFKDSSVESKYKNFVNGIPDMLMTDLGHSEKIKLVERLQIDKALKHFKIEQSGLINEETAIQIGQWLGAKWILLGNFSAIGEMIRIDCRIIDVKEGTLLKSAKMEGKTIELFSIVDGLASKILDAFTGEMIEFRLKEPKVLLDRVYEFDWPTGRDYWRLTSSGNAPQQHVATFPDYRLVLVFYQGPAAACFYLFLDLEKKRERGVYAGPTVREHEGILPVIGFEESNSFPHEGKIIKLWAKVLDMRTQMVPYNNEKVKGLSWMKWQAKIIIEEPPK